MYKIVSLQIETQIGLEKTKIPEFNYEQDLCKLNVSTHSYWPPTVTESRYGRTEVSY